MYHLVLNSYILGRKEYCATKLDCTHIKGLKVDLFHAVAATRLERGRAISGPEKPADVMGHMRSCNGPSPGRAGPLQPQRVSPLANAVRGGANDAQNPLQFAAGEAPPPSEKKCRPSQSGGCSST